MAEKKTRSKKSVEDNSENEMHHDILQLILDRLPLMLLLVDRDYRVRYLNRTALDYTEGYTGQIKGELIGNVFRCLESFKTEEGCGYAPHCGSCSYRHLVEITIKQERSYGPFESVIQKYVADGSSLSVPVQIQSSLLRVGEEKMALIVLTDITRQKETEYRLRQSEEKLRSTLDSMSDLVFSLDRDGRFSDFYQPASDHNLLVPREIFSGRHYNEVLPPYYASLIDDAFSSLKEGRSNVQEVEYSVEVKNSVRWYSSKISRRQDPEGRFDGATIVSRDITKLKETEQQLQEKEVKLSTILDTVPDMVFEINPDGAVEFSNREAVEKLGWSNVKEGKVRLLDFMNADDLMKNIEMVEHFLGQRDVLFNQVLDLKTSDGRIIPVETNSRLLYNKNGYSILGVARDISRRKSVEDALRSSEDKYRHLVESSVDMIIRVDVEGVFTYINPTGCGILGYDEKDIIGKSYAEFIREDYRERAVAFYYDQWERKLENTYFEMPVIRGNGETVWLSQNVQAIIKDDEIIAFQAISRDITRLMEIRQKLMESEERFRTLSENSFDTIMRFDRDLRHLYVNPVVESQTGIAPEKFIGKTHRELGFPEELVEMWETALQKVLDTAEVNRIEFMLPNGIWMDWLLIPEVSLSGEVTAIITSARDISKRKEMEDALKASEKRFEEFMNYMPGVAFMKDADGNYIYYNQEFRKIIGMSHDAEFRVFKDSDIWPENVAAPLRKTDLEVLESGSSVRSIQEIPQADGIHHWLAIKFPVPDEHNRATLIGGVGLDMTENIKAQQEIAKFHTIAENANYGLSITDLDGKMLYVNPYFARVHGYEPEELVGKDYSLFLIGHDDPSVSVIRKQLAQKMSFDTCEVWHRTSDGRVFPMLSNGIAINDLNGNPIMVAANSVDITELKEAEEAIKASEKRFRLLVSKIADGVVVLDGKGFVLFANPAAEGMFGRQPGGLVGIEVGLSVLSHEDEFVSILGAEGYRPQTEIKSVEIEWEGEQAYLVSIRDISERRRVEELNRLLEAERMVSGKMRELDRLKNEFVQTVTHELRTPVTILRSAIDQLVGGSLGEFNSAQKQFMEMMQRNISRLTRFATDVLALSRIDTGIYAINARPINIAETLKPEIELIKAKAESMNIRISYEDNQDIYAFADADAVCQIITNLVNNAIMHNSEGTSVQVLSHYVDSNYIEIEVRDDGKGIPEEEFERIFDRFYQVSRKSGAGYKGIGLGLAVCKELVERMGGKIWVEKGHGRGVSFKFYLPSILLKDGLVFGRLAVAMGYLRSEQVAEIGRMQMDGARQERIGDLFVKMGYLEEKERDEILAVQQELLSRPHPRRSEHPLGDSLLGLMALKSGFINEEQLCDALCHQQQQAEAGRRIKLGEAMREMGFIKSETLAKLLSRQSI